MLRIKLLALCSLGFVIGCGSDGPSGTSEPSSGIEAPSADDLYFVGSYDPSADPAVDVNRAVAVATQQNKRILLQVGGDWCSWCHRMSAFFHDTSEVDSALRHGFLLVKINKSDENSNEEFLKQYPEISGYPHLFVLDSDGGLLHSQDTVELEEDSSYSQDAVLAFLAEWAPPRD